MSNFSNEVGSYQIAPNPFTWYTCATLPSVFFLYDKYAPHDLEHCILHLHWNKFKDDNSVHYQMAAAPPKKLSNITLKNHRTVCIKCLLAEFEQFFGHLLQVHSSQLPQMPHARSEACKQKCRNETKWFIEWSTVLCFYTQTKIWLKLIRGIRARACCLPQIVFEKL